MSQLNKSDRSNTYIVWLLGALFVFQFPVKYAFDCLIVFYLFPHFFQTSSTQDAPFPVFILGLVYFGTTILLRLSISLLKSMKNAFQFINDCLTTNSRGDFVGNVLSALIQESDSNKLLREKEKKEQTDEVSIGPEDFREAHLEYLKGIPLESLRYVFITFLAKILLPESFVYFELLDVLWFSISFAALVTIFKMVSELLLVAICIWRLKVEKTKV